MRKTFIVAIGILVGLGVGLWFGSGLIADKPAVETAPSPPSQTAAEESAKPAEKPTAATETASTSASEPQTTLNQASEAANADFIRVYGTVTDVRTGAPIAGATLENAFGTFPGDHEELFELAREQGMAAASGDRQTFSIQHVETDAAGTYEVFVPPTSKRMECSAAGYAGSTLQVDGSTGDVRLDFQLHPEATITGRVLDEGGKAVVGAKVHAEDVRTTWSSRLRARFNTELTTMETDENGVYRLTGLLPGNYRVLADAFEEGFLFDDDHAPIVNLEEGQQLAAVDLHVKQGGRVQGTVWDSDGNPVMDAHVAIDYDQSAGGILEDLSFGEHRLKTNTDGEFVIPAVELNRSFHVVADHKDWASAESDPIKLTSASPEAELRLTLLKGQSVTGVVVTGNDGPVEGEYVRLSKEGENPFISWDRSASKTNANGTFTFTNILPGSYTLQARGVSQPITVADNADLTGLRIVVKESTKGAPVLEGVVLGPEGAPAAGVEVSLHMSMGPPMAMSTAETGEDGTFTLTDDTGMFGIYDATSRTASGDAVPEGYDMASMFEVRAKSAQGTASLKGFQRGQKVTLKLEPAAQITGIVLDSEGEPVAGCSLKLVDKSPSASESPTGFMEIMGDAMDSMFGGEGIARTDATGQFSFENVTSGTYAVEAVSKLKGAGESQVFTVSGPTSPGNLTIILEAGVPFSGQVMGPDGRPVADALVELRRTGESQMAEMMASFSGMDYASPDGAATTDAQGNFTIANVAHGRYAVRASHPDFAPFTQSGVDVPRGSGVSGFAITLARGGGVRGTLVSNGAPLANTMIMLMGVGAPHMVTTDAQGQFEVTGLPSGTYMAMVMSEEAMQGNTATRPTSVTVVDGEIAEINLGPGNGATVSGTLSGTLPPGMKMIRLTDPNAPVPAAPESMEDAMAYFMAFGTQPMGEVNEDGTFSVPDVAPGTYTLEVYSIDPMAAMQLMNNMDNLADMVPKPVYTQSVTVGTEPLSLEVKVP